MSTFDDVRAVCLSREVDLVFTPAASPDVLSLRGQFDDYGEFFYVVARDVEYLDLANGITVGDIILAQDLSGVASLTQKWSYRSKLYSGPTLVVRHADAGDWASAANEQLFVVVANSVEFRPGADWKYVRDASHGNG